MNTNWREFFAISYLFAPLLIGLTVHGLSIKFGWLAFLVHPIDQGKSFRGKRIFGANKTYRGVVAFALGTALGFAVQAFVLHKYEVFRQVELINYSPFVVGLGFLIGFAAMLSELLNSFIKRQIDIAPGATTGGVLSLCFYIFDQIDFLLGAWIVLTFFINFTFQRVLFSILFMFVSHQIISVFGYLLGMRKTAR
jgi:CDP-archaeol synthase